MKVHCVLTINFKKGEKTLKQVEKDQKSLLKKLNRVKLGNPDNKNKKQSYAIKSITNIYE